MTKIKKGNQ